MIGLVSRACLQRANIVQEEHDWNYEEKVQKGILASPIRAPTKRSHVPAIPADIGFGAGKERSRKENAGALTQRISSNPAVLLGLGLTTLTIVGMMKASFSGDKARAQQYMRYRIVAQFFTVTALAVGASFLGSRYSRKREQTANS